MHYFDSARFCTLKRSNFVTEFNLESIRETMHQQFPISKYNGRINRLINSSSRLAGQFNSALTLSKVCEPPKKSPAASRVSRDKRCYIRGAACITHYRLDLLPRLLAKNSRFSAYLQLSSNARAPRSDSALIKTQLHFGQGSSTDKVGARSRLSHSRAIRMTTRRRSGGASMRQRVRVCTYRYRARYIGFIGRKKFPAFLAPRARGFLYCVMWREFCRARIV